MMSETILQGGVLFILVFLLTVVGELWLIPRLRAKKAAQPILEIGPAWHAVKSGTPTLGGLAFVLACTLGVAVLAAWGGIQKSAVWQKPLLLTFFALVCALIGFFDDWKKLAKRKNQGLRAGEKYLLQLLAAAVFLLLARRLFGLSTAIQLPFGDAQLDLGVFYYPLALLYLTGIVNALNLTDGVDGLLSCTTGVFAVSLLLGGEHFSVITGALLLGAVMGFLCFNLHPASVFMGDTGSLFLGAMVAGYGILSQNALSVLIAGGVFVIEAFSVMLQVVYFKLTRGKRLFRMAPLHHHFEKMGWSENAVVAVFSLAGVVFAVISVIGG